MLCYSRSYLSLCMVSLTIMVIVLYTYFSENNKQKEVEPYVNIQSMPQIQAKEIPNTPIYVSGKTSSHSGSLIASNYKGIYSPRII